MFKHVLQEVEKLELEKYIARDIIDKFEFHNYGHALEILHNAFPTEWGELQECLRRLHLTLADIKKAGGNESPIPKKFDNILYAFGWREIRISGDLTVKNIRARLPSEGAVSQMNLMKLKQSKDT